MCRLLRVRERSTGCSPTWQTAARLARERALERGAVIDKHEVLVAAAHATALGRAPRRARLAPRGAEP